MPDLSVVLFLLALSACSSTLILLYLAYKMRQRFGKLDRNLGKQEGSVETLTLLSHQLADANKHLSLRLDRIDERYQHSKEQLAALLKSRDQQQKAIAELGGVIRDGHLSTDYIIALNALPLKFPVFLGSWTIDGITARCLVDTLREKRPAVVLELGSGASTVLIAATLQALGLSKTRHIAVEHLPEYLQKSQANLQLQQLSTNTEFWLCPLVPAEKEGEPPWYDGVPAKLGTTKIDVLLVDGPPGSSHPASRRPALDVLQAHLAPNALILLDDASRDEETLILKRWQQDYPHMQIQHIKKGKGCAVINWGTSHKAINDDDSTQGPRS